MSLPPPDNQPWKSRQWWRKERLNQAVLQLTTRCQQRFMWWGFQDICSLSGGNITIFFHICHRIWDGFQKSQSHLPQEKQTDLLDGGSINKDIQDAGILFASNEWFNKLPEEPGGDSRRAFVEQLGMRLNSDLMNDLSMSYPGGSGISLTLSEFSAGDESTKLLRNFINEAIGYAAIVEREHSSKSKLGGRRIKFYLNPILCPRFQLPEAKTKEPFYWTADRLFDLLMRSNVNLERRQRSSSKIDHKQYLIPGFED